LAVTEPRPLVVKIGGGLLRARGLDGLRQACSEAREIASRRPVLVVPGGGPFADTVRAVDVAVGLADDVAHELALGAMDQLGVLVQRLLPAAESLDALLAPRALAVLLSVPAFRNHPEVPASWAVTSDSLAVLAARAIGAREAVLLKDVPGVFARWPADGPPLPGLTADELARLQARGGGRAVDAYLPEAVRRTGVAAVVRDPAGAGTRITPG
jgi:5-(aminomethyl)-3-furanmethanol phosphate kinase